MSLNARLVAIEGIGFTPIQIAVQGLLDYIAAGGTTSSRMRATTERKLKVIRDVKHRLPHGVATAAARAPAQRVTQPVLPTVEIVSVAPVVFEALPEVVVSVPVRVSAVAQARPARGRTAARGLSASASVRRAITLPTIRRSAPCAMAWTIPARCSAAFALPQAKSGTRATEFDDVYAQQIYATDDEEDLLLLAVAAL